MDRDEYFQILEEACCYNMENYVTDPEWSGLSGLSHIPKSEKEYDSNKDYLINGDNKNKDKNAFKILE